MSFTRWLLILLVSPLLRADDPCSDTSRMGALGQTAEQMIGILDLNRQQERDLQDIQLAYFGQIDDLMPKVEVARQKYLDFALKAAEKSKASGDEPNTGTRKHLSELMQKQNDLRKQLLAIWDKSQVAVWELLTNKQRERLAGFQPDVQLSEETVESGRRLLIAFREILRAHFKDGAKLSQVDALRERLEEAEGLVYLPDWFVVRLDQVFGDVDLYRDEILESQDGVKVDKDQDLRHMDLFLEMGLRLMVQSLGQVPEADFEETFPILKTMEKTDYYRAVMLTPIMACMLDEE